MLDSRTNPRANAVGDALTRMGAELGTEADGPLHDRLGAALRSGIREGRLPSGTRLPPSRLLAADLGISRGVVVEAYAQLVAEGYLTARVGSGTWVSEHLSFREPDRTPDAPDGEQGDGEPAPQPRAHYDFRPGIPDLATFPVAGWARALQWALRRPGRGHLDYPEPSGPPEVRRALAGYLTRSRAAHVRPGDVVVTSGFAQGLALVCQVLHRRGHTRIAVEDPGLPDLRERIRWQGLEPVPVPVDGEGLRVDALEAAGPRAVLVTPAHQYPTGVVLSAERRAALAGWARARDGWMIEDDYDAEFRYDGEPVGCLQGMAPERVVHAGTASKTLGPGLRLGWLVVPPALRDELAAAKEAADLGTPVLDQWAFVRFLESGGLDRHLRRARQVYRRRRDRLLAAAAAHLPGSRPRGIAAGLHLVLELPAGSPAPDGEALAQAAAERALVVRTLSEYCVEAEAPPALVLGYTRLAAADLEPGIAALAEALEAATGPLTGQVPDERA
jgi:GntR family transcriptional regulator / MocR family aminotransferase